MKNKNYNSQNYKLKRLLNEGEILLRDYFKDFVRLYEISHNSEKLLITLSSAILVASFSFIKILPEANFKILLLISWINFFLVDVIIVWNQIHYRNACANAHLFLIKWLLIKAWFLTKAQEQKEDDNLERILHNFEIALGNINYSISNAQLLFITGVFFILGFSIVNFINEYLIFLLIPFFIWWISIVVKNFRKPLLYKND